MKPSRSTPGRRSRTAGRARSGRQLRAIPLRAGEQPVALDLPASLRAALLRSGLTRGPQQILPADLRRRQFSHRQRALLVFVIDASQSMGEGTLARMKAAKGAILALLTAAYQNRDQVALVSFRERQAQVLLRPTSSVLLAQQQLRKLAIGGATPFADGLWQAWQLVRSARQKQPNLQPLLVIVSDGEANVPLVPGAQILPELFTLAHSVRKDRISSLVIDSRAGLGSEKLQQLATELGGSYQQIRELHAGKLIEVIRRAEDI